jgi:hypothetical protein
MSVSARIAQLFLFVVSHRTVAVIRTRVYHAPLLGLRAVLRNNHLYYEQPFDPRSLNGVAESEGERTTVCSPAVECMSVLSSTKSLPGHIFKPDRSR